MSMKKITETKRVCDICGSDQNIFNVCCICGKELCFNCTKKEMFMPTSTPCRECWRKYPILEAIRGKYIKAHYDLSIKEAKEMKKSIKGEAK